MGYRISNPDLDTSQ